MRAIVFNIGSRSITMPLPAVANDVANVVGRIGRAAVSVLPMADEDEARAWDQVLEERGGTLA